MATQSNGIPNSVFKGAIDRYNGITVSSDIESCDNEQFPIKLEESLKEWMEKKQRGIWFKVFLEQSCWIPHLINKGFKYHHAQETYAMLYKWLPQHEQCNIPPYPHTSIGVGGLVLNDNNQVLVVFEKYRYFEHWKLPGGYAEPRENLIDAVKREVMEETGIKTEYLTLLCFTHIHGGAYGCSDIYVVIALKALTTEVTKCSRELDDCKWMDIDEYMNHDQVIEANKLVLQKFLEYKKNQLKINCDDGAYAKIKKAYQLYHVVKDKL